MRRMLASLLEAGLLLLFAAPFLAGQETECAEDSTALLQPTDNAYNDAMDLGRALSDHGFTIRCIQTSKMAALFSGIEGAALYRTNFGDFDVLFVPSPQNFAGLKVVEHQGKKKFAYSFSGKPRPAGTNHLESVHRVYFIPHENQMLVLTDDQLRIKLADALNLPKE